MNTPESQLAALERTLHHEQVANEARHWVRITAACNSRCVFCLDSEAQDGRMLGWEDVCREIRRGREEKDATRIVISGGEASIHPRFADFVRYAKSSGYRWVQTVTNGRRYAKKSFYLAAVDAGLDEITFSLHGHNAELHDRLTVSPGSFDELLLAMMRAVRDRKLVVNVDVVINKQNVEHLEKIVALCARIGVREFDLLHVIPQGEAFQHREELFYDPAEHAESLRRVFRLARHADFHIWTNRFPVAQLEGLEELIQDPHKMLDEVGGRRLGFRRFADGGEVLECRDSRRCGHCFIEPFCTRLDAHLQAVEEEQYEIWDVGADLGLADQLPARWLGLEPGPEPLPERPLYVSARALGGRQPPAGSRVVVRSLAELGELAADVEVELHVNREVASALLVNPAPVQARADHIVLHAPTHLHMETSVAEDPDWFAFFTQLAAVAPGLRAQNLPPCLAPGARIEAAPRRMAVAELHDDGRLGIDTFVERYIREEYRTKSTRCSSCVHDKVCPGAHIQHLRHAGLGVLRPVTEGPPAPLRPPPARLADGAPPPARGRRLPAPGRPPVPEIDVLPGRRS